MLPRLPLLLAIASGVVYHVSQRAARAALSPWPLLVLTYTVALVACLVLWGAEGTPMRLPDRGTMLAGLALGLAVLGVEVGFFLIYRGGGALSSASVISNLGVTAVLALGGIAILGEAMTGTRLGGIGLGAIAAWMMVRG